MLTIIKGSRLEHGTLLKQSLAAGHVARSSRRSNGKSLAAGHVARSRKFRHPSWNSLTLHRRYNFERRGNGTIHRPGCRRTMHNMLASARLLACAQSRCMHNGFVCARIWATPSFLVTSKHVLTGRAASQTTTYVHCSVAPHLHRQLSSFEAAVG